MLRNLIISDVDGTLINSEEADYLLPELIDAVRRYQEVGGYFSLATGRPGETALPIAKRLGVNSPIIVQNGAQIINMDGTELYSSRFPLVHLREFLDIVLDKMLLIFAKDGTVYCSQRNEDCELYERKENVQCQLIDRDSMFTDTVVYKALLIGDVDYCQEVWATMPEELQNAFSYVKSEDDYVEFLEKGVNKGHALEILLEKLDLEVPNCIAIGNHMNDAAMLEIAGLGIAVNNATDELKDIAGQISDLEYGLAVADVLNTCSKLLCESRNNSSTFHNGKKQKEV